MGSKSRVKSGSLEGLRIAKSWPPRTYSRQDSVDLGKSGVLFEPSTTDYFVKGVKTRVQIGVLEHILPPEIEI